MTIRHIVMLRFRAETAAAERAHIESEFAALATRIREVQSLEWGTNHSAEGLDKGFTHCFTLGFANAAARDVYLVHPTHQAFVALLQPQLADVLVIDYDVLAAGAGA